MNEHRPTPNTATGKSVGTDRQATGKKPAGSTQVTGLPQYLRWLGILCAVMALFCVGVFLIGYKGPSFGRVATLVLLVAASIFCFWLSKKKAR
ncbi:MAG: SecY family transport protein [Adlercreutzia sp.]|nr:SecY family transport protein [Adlercreutzia sp.]